MLETGAKQVKRCQSEVQGPGASDLIAVSDLKRTLNTWFWFVMVQYQVKTHVSPNSC